MKKNKTTPALAAALLTILTGCQTAAVATDQAAAKTALTIQTHTAGGPGFEVNSHLIAGRDEAILVDAQFTRSEARKAAALVKASGKALKAIFVTHGHPDHYLGLEILSKEFPGARILATKGVIADIRKTAQGKLDYWKPMYKEDLADRFIVPEALEGSELELEGERIAVHELKEAGESESAAILYVPSLKALVAGDLAYNGVHLWLAENRPEGWLSNLGQARGVGAIERVLTGHGPSADAGVLADNETYIRDFVKATEKPATRKAAKAALKQRYPKHSLPIIAELSVDARVAK